MHSYDKQVTLRLIGVDRPLRESYSERCRRYNNDYDQACWETFSVDIAGHPTRTPEYDKIYEEMRAGREEATRQLPDSPLAAHLRLLIKQNGWEAFRTALIQLSASKKRQMRVLGLSDHADQWEKIEGQFSNLRKSVQL